MPFADYKNFKDCVKKNQDKDDPEAYCAAIQRKVEKGKKRKRPKMSKKKGDIRRSKDYVGPGYAATMEYRKNG